MSSPTGQPKKTIRQMRDEHGWAQLDVAVGVGASTSAVARWERGEVVPRDKYHERLAKLFGVSVEEIAFGQDGQS